MRTHLHSFFDRLTNSPHWLAWSTALLVAGILLFSTPYVHYLPGLIQGPYWQTVLAQANADFLYQPDGTGANAYTHESKKTFRLTVPLLMRALHIGPYAVYALQCVAGVAFVSLILLYINREFGSRKLAVWMGIAVTSVHVGTALFTDVYAYFSGWAFFFLLCAIYVRRAWLVFLFCLLVAWTDERGVLALAYVALYWQYVSHPAALVPWRLSVAPGAWAAVAALALYAAGRACLQALGYYTPFPGLWDYLARNLDVFQFGTWTFFEGLWLLVLYKYYLLVVRKRFNLLAVNLMVTVPMWLSSFLVWDITRSGSFLFIEVFLSALIIYREAGLPALYKYTKWSALVCLLFPPYYVITDSGPLILQRSVLYVAAKSVYSKLTGVY